MPEILFGKSRTKGKPIAAGLPFVYAEFISFNGELQDYRVFKENDTARSETLEGLSVDLLQVSME